MKARGFYLLNRKYKPFGSNRVDFHIVGNMVSINYDPPRLATRVEINQLIEASRRCGLITIL